MRGGVAGGAGHPLASSWTLNGVEANTILNKTTYSPNSFALALALAITITITMSPP